MKMTPTLGGAYSGSFGGLTASHNKGGAYFRRRSVPTDPSSAFQAVIRDAFATLSQQWTNSLTPAQRTAWDDYAQQVAWTDTLGQTIQLSGQNHFIRANVPRLQCTFYRTAPFGSFDPTTNVITAAPVINDLGQTPILGTPTLVVAGGAATLSIPNTTPGAIATDAALIYVSPPMNESIEFWKGPYILSAANVGNQTPLLVDLAEVADSPYTARYPAPAVGQKIVGYVRLSMTDGRLTVAAPFRVTATAT